MKKIYYLFLNLLIIGFASAQEVPVQKIQNYLNNNAIRFDLNVQDVQSWELESYANSTSTGIENFYIRQTYQGVPVFNSTSNVWIKNNEVLDVKLGFVKNLSTKINTILPQLSAIQAIESAHSILGETIVNHEVIEVKNNEKTFILTNGNSQEDFVTANLVFQLLEENVKLAWELSYYSPDYKHYWNLRIDALNGDLLEKFDLTISCNFGDENHKNHNHDNFYFTKFLNKENYLPAQVQSGTYRVIPFNYESPNHSPFQLISTPHNVVASPYGWHDTNGVNGAEFTITRGNNVLAQDDTDGNNGSGSSPNGGLTLTFDYPYGGTSVAASTYLNAANTNLFYMNNIMHDVWYQYGFNEVNGNFQQNNYGKGGTITFLGDYVFADSQDGSGTNNANFSTPVDGTNPRMQMYLWDVGPTPKDLLVNSPSSIAGGYFVADNAFDPGHVNLPAIPGITTDLVLYEDAVLPSYTDGCEAPVNPSLLSGKIVIVRRGNCNFTVKVLNAQNAGAIAVIVVNNDTANPNQYVNMSGAEAGISIPAVFVTYNIGEAIIAEMQNGTVNVTLRDDPATFVNTDGDFDNGVISHEYTHGISTRLTGGPGNSSCLQSSEQMGEGWSDWAALMMQMKPGDQPDDYRGIATFAVSQPTNGGGIRQYPYTPNMSINPLTFGDTNGMWYTDANGVQRIDVHSVGTVWATMLWDLTWAYVDKYGFDSDIYNGTGGNNKVMRLVLDALKLQPCNPSFVSARDAIIAADQATTGGQDYCMIWEVFARRGLGVNASSGSNSGIAGINDQVEDFTEPSPGPNCILNVDYFENQDMIKVYPNPNNGYFTIQINNYIGNINVEIFDINGRKIESKNIIDFNIQKQISIENLQSGIYLMKINGDNISYSKKIIKN